MGTLSEADVLPPPLTVAGTDVGLGVTSTMLTPSNSNELGSTVAEASAVSPSALASVAKVVEKVPLSIAVENNTPMALFRELASDASPDSVISQIKTTPPESSRAV